MQKSRCKEQHINKSSGKLWFGFSISRRQSVSGILKITASVGERDPQYHDACRSAGASGGGLWKGWGFNLVGEKGRERGWPSRIRIQLWRSEFEKLILVATIRINESNVCHLTQKNIIKSHFSPRQHTLTENLTTVSLRDYVGSNQEVGGFKRHKLE